MSRSGKMLSELMRERRVSQYALSRMTGLSEATIRRMRSGDLNGTFDSWCRVLSALDADANEFVRSCDGREERDGSPRP